MCTVSWLFEDGDYHLFSSRDEKHTRAVALPPCVFERHGERWIAPTDPDQIGTWITVNDRGIALCLLNGEGRRGMVSRGRLVRELAPGSDPIGRLRRAHLGLYAAFTLAVLDPAGARVLTWDGTRLKELVEAAPPLASSSLAMQAARDARSSLFHAMAPRSVGELMTFHASHAPDHGVLSPCMHRSDAATVSFTHIRVHARSASMTYYPGPLCRAPRAFHGTNRCSPSF